MNITYTWKIIGLEKQNYNNLEDIVVRLNWVKTGTNEDGVSGSFYSGTVFEVDTVNPQAFISYENLTEEKALEWVQTMVYGQAENYVNGEIFKKIVSQIYPVTKVNENDLPWNLNE
jgi:hypothetical protein